MKAFSATRKNQNLNPNVRLVKQSTNKQTFNKVSWKENHAKEEKHKDVKASKENLFFEEQNCNKKVLMGLTRKEKIYK